MAGVNQYRRRWSTQHQHRRSRTATVGRGIPILVLVVVLTVTLYIFGIVGPDARHHVVVPTLSTSLVPPPAALVVPTTIGAVEPFGTLPSVAPVMNGTPPPSLIYKLTGPLTGGAARADVFSIAWSPPSAAQVDELARRLGLTGPVRQPKAGMYTVDGNGMLSVDAKATVYAPPPITMETNSLPDDRTAIISARSWLATRDLLPPDVGPANVRRNGDTLDVIFHPKTLPVIFSDLPGIQVRIGAGNVVQEVRRAWPNELLPGAYDLISLDNAWQQAQARGMVDLRLPAGLSMPLNATALVNTVSLVYAFASDTKGRDFLQPLYLFSGTVAIPGQATGVDIRIAVPAVRNVQQSAG